MRWWWAGAYGAFKTKRPSDRVANLSGQSVLLVVGSTGTVGASLLETLPLEATPGEAYKVYAISVHPLPLSSAALPLGVFHGCFDLADPNNVAVALKPLINYVASDLQHINAADREAHMAMFHDALSFFLPNCPKRIDVCLQTSHKGLVGPFEPLSTTQLGDRLEGARVAITKEMDLQEDDILNWPFFDARLHVETKHIDPMNRSKAGFFGFRNKGNEYDESEAAAYFRVLLWVQAGFRKCNAGERPDTNKHDKESHEPEFYGLNGHAVHSEDVDSQRSQQPADGQSDYLASTASPTFPSLIIPYLKETTGDKFEDHVVHAVLSSLMDPEHEIPGSREALVGRLLHRLGSLKDLALQSLHETAVLVFTKKPKISFEPVSNTKLANAPPLAARTISPLARFFLTSTCRRPAVEKSCTPTIGHRTWLKKVLCMAGRRTLCLTFLLFIVSSFIPTVSAENGFHKCPAPGMIDSLPRNTCPVIKLTGDHWSHSKRANPPIRDISYRIPYLIAYVFKNELPWCSQFKDILQLLGIMSFWPAVWKMRQNQYVRFLSEDKSLIVVWIDTSMGSIFYHTCWMLYGHLISLSRDQSDFGQHVYHINLIACMLFISVLIILLIRHRPTGMASRSIRYRLLGLIFLVGILYCLRGIEPDKNNIFRIGAIGFGAMIPMYIMKSYTIVGVKPFAMTVNIVTISLFLCCEHDHLRSWYGCAYIGSLCYRILETARFFYLLYHRERLAGGRLHWH